MSEEKGSLYLCSGCGYTRDAFGPAQSDCSQCGDLADWIWVNENAIKQLRAHFTAEYRKENAELLAALKECYALASGDGEPSYGGDAREEWAAQTKELAKSAIRRAEKGKL